MVTRSVKKLQRSWKTFTTKSVKETSKIKEDQGRSLQYIQKILFKEHLKIIRLSCNESSKTFEDRNKICKETSKTLEDSFFKICQRILKDQWRSLQDMQMILGFSSWRSWKILGKILKQPCRDLSQDPPQRPFQMLKRLSLWSPSGLSCSKVG